VKHIFVGKGEKSADIMLKMFGTTVQNLVAGNLYIPGILVIV